MTNFGETKMTTRRFKPIETVLQLLKFVSSRLVSPPSCLLALVSSRLAATVATRRTNHWRRDGSDATN